MKKQFLGAIIALCCLSGCSPPEQKQIKLKQIELEVHSESNGCLLVDKIDNQKIHQTWIKNQVILLPDKTQIRCPVIKTDQLGKQEIIYQSQGFDYYFTVIIKDTQSPVIKAQDEYIVEQNNQYFNLKGLIEVSDNYDQSVQLEIDGYVKVDTIGEYPVEVIATDSQHNQTKKKVVVKVIEKEKIIQEKEVPITQENSSSSSEVWQNQPTAPSIPNQPSSPVYEPPIQLESKQAFFSFKDYGSFSDTLAVCHHWISSNKAPTQGGRCYPIEENGIAIGYQGIIE